MITAEDYLKNPEIAKMWELPICDKKMQEINDLITTLAGHKMDCLKQKFEELNIPNDAFFNWDENSVVLVYSPENENEDIETRTSIYDYLFILNAEYEHIVLLIFSQMEALLTCRIEKKRKKTNYEKFKLKIQKGGIESLFRYNMKLGYNEIFTEIITVIYDIVVEIDTIMRKQRNIIAHELIRTPDKEIFNKILNNGQNINVSIIDALNYYANKINVHLIQFNLFLKLIYFMFDIKFDDTESDVDN